MDSEAVVELRRRVLRGALSTGEVAALGDLIVAVDAAVHVHQAGPGPLWAQVTQHYRGLIAASRATQREVRSGE